MDYNSTTNQSIKGDFIAKHVNLCVTSMAEYILNKSHEDVDAPFCFDDITNFYTYPEFSGKHVEFEGGTEEDRDAAIAELRDRLDEMNEAESDENERLREELEADIAGLEELETEAREIYEWWAVSPYLLGKLKQRGECVIEHEQLWGRCTTGQAILLDAVISRICEGMEILEGQPHAWAK